MAVDLVSRTLRFLDESLLTLPAEVRPDPRLFAAGQYGTMEMTITPYGDMPRQIPALLVAAEAREAALVMIAMADMSDDEYDEDGPLCDPPEYREAALRTHWFPGGESLHVADVVRCPDHGPSVGEWTELCYADGFGGELNETVQAGLRMVMRLGLPESAPTRGYIDMLRATVTDGTLVDQVSEALHERGWYD